MLHYQVVSDDKVQVKLQMDSLDESYYTGVQSSSELPTLKSINTFIENVFKVGRFDEDNYCSIACLIYINRVLARTGVHLTAGNWKVLFIGALLIAQKFWDDNPLINADFPLFYPALSLKDINNLESLFLTLLKWKLLIAKSLFYQYYHELRAVYLQQQLTQDPPPVPRLTEPRIHNSEIYHSRKQQFRKQLMTLEDLLESHHRHVLG